MSLFSSAKASLVFPFSRELLEKFRRQELIHWKEIEKNFEQDLKVGSKDDPPTKVFPSTPQGQKRWKHFKERVVEHVRDPSASDHSNVVFTLEYENFGQVLHTDSK